MNRKAFTLIELLAVIVILAIIALIATPIILGIINDARESAKTRSAELVYTGVEYAYTTSMYQISNASGNITMQNIYDNFSVENTEKKGLTSTSFTVTTSEGVDCIISQASNGYEVKCGIEEDDDKYLDKSVVTSTPTSQVFKPQYYDCNTLKLNVGDDISEYAGTNPPSGKDFYLGYDVNSSDEITAQYLCFKSDKEYCLRYGEAYYSTNISILSSDPLAEALSFTPSAYDNGDLRVLGESSECYVDSGGSYCLDGGR